MQKNSLTDITLAVSGVLQAAQLVHPLTIGRMPDAKLVRASIGSLFVFQPNQTLEVFGDMEGISGGLECLLKIKNGQWAEMQYVLRYAYDIQCVERKLAQTPQMLPVLRKRLETLQPTLDSEEDIRNLCKEVDAIYQDTLSNLAYRIRLQGRPEVMKNIVVQQKIRTLLLAGVRAAMLWRQLGGTFIRLFLQHKAILATAKEELENTKR